MRLSILPSDRSVYKNGQCHLNINWEGTPENIHALQWFDDNTGWIEFNDGTYNEDIDVLPQWALNAEKSFEMASIIPEPFAPTAEEIQAKNKEDAVSILSNTDWAATVDVSNPQYSNPYLMNQDDFLSYRSLVRAIAVNPPTTPVTEWPILPKEQWSS